MWDIFNVTLGVKLPSSLHLVYPHITPIRTSWPGSFACWWTHLSRRQAGEAVTNLAKNELEYTKNNFTISFHVFSGQTMNRNSSGTKSWLEFFDDNLTFDRLRHEPNILIYKLTCLAPLFRFPKLIVFPFFRIVKDDRVRSHSSIQTLRPRPRWLGFKVPWSPLNRGMTYERSIWGHMLIWNSESRLNSDKTHTSSKKTRQNGRSRQISMPMVQK